MSSFLAMKSFRRKGSVRMPFKRSGPALAMGSLGGLPMSTFDRDLSVQRGCWTKNAKDVSDQRPLFEKALPY